MIEIESESDESEIQHRYFDGKLDFNGFLVKPDPTTIELLGYLGSKDLVIGNLDKGMLQRNISMGEFCLMLHSFDLDEAALHFEQQLHIRTLLSRSFKGFERRMLNTERQELDYNETNPNKDKWYKKIGKFAKGD